MSLCAPEASRPPLRTRHALAGLPTVAELDYNTRVLIQPGGDVMRGLAMILVAAAAIHSGARDAAADGKIQLAQTSTPNANPLTGTQNVSEPFRGLSPPLTSTTTNCMMSCNSQVANCNTSCILPAPSTAATASRTSTPTTNESGSTSCLLKCSTSHLACQTRCAESSPSR